MKKFRSSLKNDDRVGKVEIYLKNMQVNKVHEHRPGQFLVFVYTVDCPHFYLIDRQSATTVKVDFMIDKVFAEQLCEAKGLQRTRQVRNVNMACMGIVKVPDVDDLLLVKHIQGIFLLDVRRFKIYNLSLSPNWPHRDIKKKPSTAKKEEKKF